MKVFSIQTPTSPIIKAEKNIKGKWSIIVEGISGMDSPEKFWEPIMSLLEFGLRNKISDLELSLEYIEENSCDFIIRLSILISALAKGQISASSLAAGLEPVVIEKGEYNLAMINRSPQKMFNN